MKTKQLLQEIKGVFKPPKKRYYIGKIRYGTPYMNPIWFHPTIFSIRKLKLKTEEELKGYQERYPYLKRDAYMLYSNMPMVRRNKEFFATSLKNTYYITVGWPISIKSIELGWKTKWGDDPRFEWGPSFQIYFFKWQFCIFYEAPDKDDDKYYEMILRWLYFSDKDIIKAEDTWGWVDCNTKKSTWNKDYLI